MKATLEKCLHTEIYPYGAFGTQPPKEEARVSLVDVRTGGPVASITLAKLQICE